MIATNKMILSFMFFYDLISLFGHVPPDYHLLLRLLYNQRPNFVNSENNEDKVTSLPAKPKPSANDKSRFIVSPAWQ